MKCTNPKCSVSSVYYNHLCNPKKDTEYFYHLRKFLHGSFLSIPFSNPRQIYSDLSYQKLVFIAFYSDEIIEYAVFVSRFS